jgi:hypothetical protein
LVNLSEDRSKSSRGVGGAGGSISDESILSISPREGHNWFRYQLLMKASFAASGRGSGVLPGKLEQWSGDHCEVLDMRPEEVAQSYKRADCFDVIGSLGSLDGLEFILSGFNSFRSQSEAQVGNFLFPKMHFSKLIFRWF